MLKLFLRKRDYDTIAGDFEELYSDLADEKGLVRARLWYYLQVVKSFPAFVHNLLYRGCTLSKNYFIVTWRNCKKNKMFTFITLAGLVLGFTAGLVIYTYVSDELRFDAYHPDSERIFRVGDRVIHRRNNYDLGVFNGDIGVIQDIDNEKLTCVVSFFPDQRIVEYERDDIPELDLSYAITIHKSQGSEFGAVIIPVLIQHFKMLFRNLIYTGLTRAKKLAVLVGTRKALAMAVKNQDTSQRQTYLKELLQ